MGNSIRFDLSLAIVKIILDNIIDYYLSDERETESLTDGQSEENLRVSGGKDPLPGPREVSHRKLILECPR